MVIVEHLGPKLTRELGQLLGYSLHGLHRNKNDTLQWKNGKGSRLAVALVQEVCS